MHHFLTLLLLTFSIFSTFTSCAKNPVTGKMETHFISEASEIQMGTQNYLTMQQMQGGDYLTDRRVGKYINQVGQRIAKKSDRPHLPYEFIVLNNSIPNAWALPGGKICINRGLLIELESEAELAAVLSHEIVHAAARHGAQKMEKNIFLQSGLFGLGIALKSQKFEDLLLGTAAMSANLISLKYGRSAEFEADHYGILYMHKAGYDPRAAIALQETFLRLSNNKDTNWLSGLFSSHPPSIERVAANRKLVSQLQEGGYIKGDINRDEYQTVMRYLKKTKNTYDKLDQGNKALEEGNLTLASQLAQEGISLIPEEAHFYGLLGKCQVSKKQYDYAEQLFTQAISKNNNFYDFYLQRGLIKEQQKQWNESHKDLTKSIKLLPSTQGHLELGKQEFNNGKIQQAIKHLEVASSTNTPLGKESKVWLSKVELPVNPTKYLSFEPGLDSAGFLNVSIVNNSLVVIEDLALAISTINSAPISVSNRPVHYKKTLKPGKKVILATKIGPFNNKEQLKNIIQTQVTKVVVK